MKRFIITCAALGSVFMATHAFADKRHKGCKHDHYSNSKYERERFYDYKPYREVRYVRPERERYFREHEYSSFAHYWAERARAEELRDQRRREYYQWHRGDRRW